MKMKMKMKKSKLGDEQNKKGSIGIVFFVYYLYFLGITDKFHPIIHIGSVVSGHKEFVGGLAACVGSTYYKRIGALDRFGIIDDRFRIKNNFSLEL